METVSVVIPCYRGESSLPGLVDEVACFKEPLSSSAGYEWCVEELVLVFDGGEANLYRVIQELADRYRWIHPLKLSRNFGQHAATFAGIAQTKGKWVVTLDEDGEHDPRDIQQLLNVAMTQDHLLVYAAPSHSTAHGWARNSASRLAKYMVSRFLSASQASLFQSFRLIDGNLAREAARTVGPGVYFDIAFSWYVDNPGSVSVPWRPGQRRRSGYSFRTLLRHFWMLFLSVGTQTMRAVTAVGIFSAALGVVLAGYIVGQRLSGNDFPAGWASQITVTLLSSGLVLLSLGLMSEYLGSAVNKLMGKPNFFITHSRQKK